MTFAETLTLVAYFFVLIILAVYGWHRYYLVYLYFRNRDRAPKPGPTLSPMPVVTIQLPLYNEMYVADRLIESVCRIEYPPELRQKNGSFEYHSARASHERYFGVAKYKEVTLYKNQ